MTRPDGASHTRSQSFSYDTAGLVTESVIEPDDPSLKLISTYTYDVFGNRLTVTVASDAAAPATAAIAPRTATLTYDYKGQFPVSATNPLGHSETRTFDARFGTLKSLTGPNGLTTNWTYDGFGRQLTETRPDGTRTSTSYDECLSCWAGSVLSVETSETSGSTTIAPPVKTYLDTLGRPTLTKATAFDGSDAYVQREYDGRGRLLRASRPHYASEAASWTSYAFDDLNRLLSQRSADGAVTQYSYDGLSTSVTDAKSRTTTQIRNHQGQVVEIRDAANGALSYEYDAAGRPARIIDPAGNVSTLAYDTRGRRTQLNDPDSGTTTSVYDVLGQLVSQTDAKGQISHYSYDALGRMTRRSEADLVSDWYYDTGKGGAACPRGIGRLCEAEADNGYRRVSSYDNLGRLSSLATTIDTTYTASFSYDSAGRMASITYPTGFATRYVYNARGYLSELRNNASNALYWRADTTTAAGQLAAYTLGNNLSGSQGFDPLTGRLQNQQAGNGAVQSVAYSYDVVGNLLERNDTAAGLTDSFSYDALNRLTQASTSGTINDTVGFGYDALGNLTYKSDVGSYSYPQSGANSVRPHAVAAITGSVNGVSNPSFGYDANGNMTSGAARSFTWTSFDLPSRINKGAVNLDFTYGPEHQRVRQVSPSATTIYLSSPHYEKETQSSGLVLHKHYLYAGSRLIGQYTQRSNGQNDTRYFSTDHLGSVSVVTDESGAVVERLSFDAWGKRRSPNGAADPNNALRPFFDRGYTGHEHLDEAGMGLVHMNGRVYDPAIGRFAAPDPFVQAPGFSQSFNRYSYVWNNPLALVDPSGQIAAPVQSASSSPFGSAVDDSALGSVTGTPGSSSWFCDDPIACGSSSAGNPYGGWQESDDAESSAGMQEGWSIKRTDNGWTAEYNQTNVDGTQNDNVNGNIAVTNCSGGSECGASGGSVSQQTSTDRPTSGVRTTPDQGFGGGITGNPADGDPILLAAKTHCVTQPCLGGGPSYGGAGGGASGAAAGRGVGGATSTATKSAPSSHAARREVMRDTGIPTSQQPGSQSQNASGREYSYDVPAPGGGTQRMSVQQQTLDRTHQGQPHWEAGRVKTDPLTGAIRENNYGRPALTNDKSKVNY